jgi:hypothetical protein
MAASAVSFTVMGAMKPMNFRSHACEFSGAFHTYLFASPDKKLLSPELSPMIREERQALKVAHLKAYQ